jgi:HD-GYP domain-containing protein (c-di-GMP phosphodiesterase class II)
MYAVALGRAVGLSQDDLNVLRTAALLHDVGKIGIPDELLNKEEALSPEEIEVFHSHCAIGVAIISHVPALVKCSPLVLYHHEHFNGQGYPEKLKGEDIPIGARIIAVADAFAAMVSVRPYRKALTYEEAVKELLRCRGKSLDPNLVDLFIPLITTETQTGMKAATGLYGEE